MTDHDDRDKVPWFLIWFMLAAAIISVAFSRWDRNADAHMTLEMGSPTDTLAIDRILYITHMDGTMQSEWYGPPWNGLWPIEGEFRVEVWDTHGNRIRRAKVNMTELELIPPTDYIPTQDPDDGG